MATFKKYWFPAFTLLVLLFYLPAFSKPVKEIQNTEIVAEKIIDLIKNEPLKIPVFTRAEKIQFAKNAFKKTGVRTEFLFAIYNQETAQGKNTGSCFVFDPDIFGDGIGVNIRAGSFSSRIMKPERDAKPFFEIMNELGRNPYFTPVSCPMANIGFGGGMGEMQFIPSTWLQIKNEI